MENKPMDGPDIRADEPKIRNEGPLEDMAAGIETPRDTARPDHAYRELQSDTPSLTKEMGTIVLLGFDE